MCYMQGLDSSWPSRQPPASLHQLAVKGHVETTTHHPHPRPLLRTHTHTRARARTRTHAPTRMSSGQPLTARVGGAAQRRDCRLRSWTRAADRAHGAGSLSLSPRKTLHGRRQLLWMGVLKESLVHAVLSYSAEVPLSFTVWATPTLFTGISYTYPKFLSFFFIRRITKKGWVQSTGRVRIVGGCPCIWCFEY